MTYYPGQQPKSTGMPTGFAFSEKPFSQSAKVGGFKPLETGNGIADFANKSILSHKIPIAFNSQGIQIKPMQFDPNLETKLSLYPEIERLTVINYHLKKQYDVIVAENAHLKNLHGKLNTIPELEDHIARLQQERKAVEDELGLRDRVIQDKDAKIDELRQKLIEYQQLEQTNNELSHHSKSLMLEIEKLHGVIRLKDDEIEAGRAEITKLQSLTGYIDDLKRKIQLLTNELVDRNKEVELYKTRVEELGFRIGDLTLENEKIESVIQQKEAEIEHWKDQLYSRNQEYTQELGQIKADLEEEKRVIVEAEKAEMESRLKYEQDRFEEKIADVARKVKDYERKIQLLTSEIERLNEALSDKIQLLTEKNTEIEDLKSAITTIKMESEETRFVLETGKRLELENMSRDLRNEFRKEREQWEGEITKLKVELGEIDRLNRTLNDKDEEIGVVKSRMQEQEERHQRKIEEIHSTWEGRMKQAIERELKELANRFLLEKGQLENDLQTAMENNERYQSKIMMLGDELKKLTDFAEEKNHEIITLRQEISTKEINHQKQFQEYKRLLEGEKRQELDTTLGEVQRSYDGQLERAKEKHRDLENRLMTLIDENSRLSSLRDDLAREVDSLKLRLRSTEQNYQQSLAEIERKNDLSAKINLEKEKNEWQARLEVETSMLESRIHSLTQSVTTLESKNAFLASERDRLAAALNAKVTENEELKKKFAEFERSRNQELENLKKQFEAYKLASIDMHQIEKQFEAERSTLQDELNQSKERCLQLENKVTRLNAENDRMHQNLIEKTREMDGLKKEIRGLEDRFDQERRQLEEQLDEARKGSYDAKELTIKFASEKASYENQIRQLKTINENGKQELEKLYDLMNQRKREHESYVRQNEDLRRQVERLQRQLKEVEDQTAEGNERYEDLRAKISELERERDYYQTQADKYSNDLTKRNNELHEKIQELDALKQRYEISIDKINADLAQKFRMGENK